MTNTEDLPPLEDPKYQPAHVPVNGKPPEVVKKWSPRSQKRWFGRFWPELYIYVAGQKQTGMMSREIAEDYYCHSVQHRGCCCASCISEQEEGYDYLDEDCCCCRAFHYKDLREG